MMGNRRFYYLADVLFYLLVKILLIGNDKLIVGTLAVVDTFTVTIHWLYYLPT